MVLRIAIRVHKNGSGNQSELIEQAKEMMVVQEEAKQKREEEIASMLGEYKWEGITEKEGKEFPIVLDFKTANTGTYTIHISEDCTSSHQMSWGMRKYGNSFIVYFSTLAMSMELDCNRKLNQIEEQAKFAKPKAITLRIDRSNFEVKLENYSRIN